MRISTVFGAVVFVLTLAVGWGTVMFEMLTFKQVLCVAVIYGLLGWGLVWLNES